MYSCAITGSTGVLGRKIKKNLPFKFICFKKDITKPKQVDEWIRLNNFEILIHLAAVVPTDKVKKNFNRAKKINVSGTRNIINSILKKEKKPKWIFFASTSHVYSLTKSFKKISEKTLSRPSSQYGLSKRMAEIEIQKKLKKSLIKYCIGRIFSFTDKVQKKPFLIPVLTEKIKKKEGTLLLKNLNHNRDFLSTDDICKAIYKLYINKATGIFNIGSGKNFYLKDIAKLLAKKNNKKVQFINNKKPTYLISNNRKILKLGWKPKKFKKKLSYFY